MSLYAISGKKAGFYQLVFKTVLFLYSLYYSMYALNIIPNIFLLKIYK